LKGIVGVVETGLFIDLATEIIVASSDGVKVHHRR
jgi:ribose 5-phosphate isomerase